MTFSLVSKESKSEYLHHLGRSAELVLFPHMTQIQQVQVMNLFEWMKQQSSLMDVTAKLETRGKEIEIAFTISFRSPQ